MTPTEPVADAPASAIEREPVTHRCPACGEGRMVIVETFPAALGDPRGRVAREPAPLPAGCDSS